MNKIIKPLIIVFVLSVGFSSCKRDTVYLKYHKFQNNTWKRINEDILFEVEIDDSSRRYNIDIPVRHASFYPHQYLEISFNVYSPSGQGSYTAKKIYLKDEKGNWKGNGMGDIWDYTFRIFDNYKFNETGTYLIEIQNLTGNNMLLPGIMELGLKIKKAKKGNRG